MFGIHIAYLWWFVIAGCLLCIGALWRFFYYRPVRYAYALTSYILQKHKMQTYMPQLILYGLRLSIFCILIILIGRPQTADNSSQTSVEGIDIVLVMDVSGSMQCFDNPQQPKSRLAIAKQEAHRFVQKRPNDAIGLVIFGRYALTRCPITPDKRVITELIDSLQLGQPSKEFANGTVLAQGIATGVRRLQKSQAASKVIIVLTDGEPSAEDIPPQDAVDIAQQVGVRVYTIGIGGDKGGYIKDPIFGIRPIGTRVNKRMLHMIADKTGGAFFEASDEKQLQKIYDTIDHLEKTKYETTIYHKYHDAFMPWFWLLGLLLLLELCITTWLWVVI